MKKLCLSLTLCLCLLMSGCGGREFAKARDNMAQRLAEAECLSFTANLRAEYEQKTARFTLSYYEDADGGKVMVLAPQLIAGVTARIQPGSTSLEYDGVCLGTGELDDFGLSPMSALPMLVQALRDGGMNSGWTESGSTVLELQSTDELRCTVWFDAATMVPRQAELSSDGRVKVFAEISDWQEGPAPAAPEETTE